MTSLWQSESDFYFTFLQKLIVHILKFVLAKFGVMLAGGTPNFIPVLVQMRFFLTFKLCLSLDSEALQACFHVFLITMKLFFSIQEFRSQKISSSTENVYLVKISLIFTIRRHDGKKKTEGLNGRSIGLKYSMNYDIQNDRPKMFLLASTRRNLFLIKHRSKKYR